MVRDEIKNLTQSEVLKNVHNLTDEELKYHGIKRIPFDEIPAVYVDDIEEYAKANGYLNQEEYNERINNAMAGVKDIEHLEQPESLQEFLRSLSAMRRKLRRDFTRGENKDLEVLVKGWEEYYKELERFKEFPNIDDSLEEDKEKFRVKFKECRSYEELEELEEWWDDRHPHIAPEYDITAEEFCDRFHFVRLEEALARIGNPINAEADNDIPYYDMTIEEYRQRFNTTSYEAMRKRMSTPKNVPSEELLPVPESDREQEEFIEQCRRELEARVEELRLKRQQ